MPVRSLLMVVGLAALFAASSGHTQAPPTTAAPAATPAAEAPKFPEYAAFLKGSKVIDGLFTLHHKDEHLYAEIGPGQLNKPYLVPMAIAKGAGVGGATL